MLPRLGDERPPRVRLRREHLDAAARRERARASSYALRSLQRRFPRALAQAVGDVPRWVRGVERRLGALRRCGEGEEWPAALTLLTEHPQRLRRAWLPWLSDPQLARLSEALLWTLVDEPSALRRAPERLARWAPWLRQLLRRAPERGLELALRACEAEQAEPWGPLLEVLGDPLTWETALRGAAAVRAFAGALARQRQPVEGPLAPPPALEPPPVELPRVLLELALEFGARRDAELRARSLALLGAYGALLPREVWAEWWVVLRDTARRARQLAGLRHRSADQALELHQLCEELREIANQRLDPLGAQLPEELLRELLQRLTPFELLRLTRVVREAPSCAPLLSPCRRVRDLPPRGRALVLSALEAFAGQQPEVWGELEGHPALLWTLDGLAQAPRASRRAIERALAGSVRRWGELPETEPLLAAARRFQDAELLLAYVAAAREAGVTEGSLVELCETPRDLAPLAPLGHVDWEQRSPLRLLCRALRPEDDVARAALRRLGLEQPSELRRLARRFYGGARVLRAGLLRELRLPGEPEELLERLDQRWRRELERRLGPRGGRELPPRVRERFAATSELDPGLSAHFERLLRARQGPPPWDLRAQRANAEWCSEARGRGLDLAPWLEGPPPRILPSQRGPLTFQLEADPLEVLDLAGHLGFGSAVASRARLDLALGVALDLNKRLLCARDAQGALVARCVLGLSSSSHLTLLRPEVLEPSLRALVERAARDFVRDLAGAIGCSPVNAGHVSSLLSHADSHFDDWQDSPPFPVHPSGEALHLRLLRHAASEDSARWARRLRVRAPHGQLSGALAGLLVRRGRRALPPAHFLELVPLLPPEPWLLLEAARWLISHDQTSLALHLLEQVQPADCGEGCCNALHQVAQEQRRLGRLDLALVTLRRAEARLSARTSPAAVVETWARVLAGLGRRQRALRVLKRARGRSGELDALRRELEG